MSVQFVTLCAAIFARHLLTSSSFVNGPICLTYPKGVIGNSGSNIGHRYRNIGYTLPLPSMLKSIKM